MSELHPVNQKGHTAGDSRVRMIRRGSRSAGMLITAQFRLRTLEQQQGTEHWQLTPPLSKSAAPHKEFVLTTAGQQWLGNTSQCFSFQVPPEP